MECAFSVLSNQLSFAGKSPVAKKTLNIKVIKHAQTNARLTSPLKCYKFSRKHRSTVNLHGNIACPQLFDALERVYFIG